MIKISFLKATIKLAERKRQQMNLRKERNRSFVFTYKIHRDSDMMMITSERKMDAIAI